MEQVVRDVRRDVQRDERVAEPGEVQPGVLQVPGGANLRRECEQRDRHTDGDHERDGEDDRVAGDAGGLLDPVEHFVPHRAAW